MQHMDRTRARRLIETDDFAHDSAVPRTSLSVPPAAQRDLARIHDDRDCGAVRSRCHVLTTAIHTSWTAATHESTTDANATPVHDGRGWCPNPVGSAGGAHANTNTGARAGRWLRSITPRISWGRRFGEVARARGSPGNEGRAREAPHGPQ